MRGPHGCFGDDATPTRIREDKVLLRASSLESREESLSHWQRFILSSFAGPESFSDLCLFYSCLESLFSLPADIPVGDLVEACPGFATVRPATLDDRRTGGILPAYVFEIKWRQKLIMMTRIYGE